MKFEFLNAEDLLPGIDLLLADLGIERGAGEYTVDAVHCDVPTLKVELKGKCAVISYHEKCQFFRALGLLVEHLRDGESEISLSEKPQFTMNGIMFDMSQGNAAFNLRQIKSVLRNLAVMGLNMMMLYTEDTYEVEGHPYFGYMRPRYSEAMLREADDYAYTLGIEMIPCIQTLSHLKDVLKWHVYDDVKDTRTNLLVGEEKTYEFIEAMIRSASRPFRTKRIHIGMDEAIAVGTGNYLKKHGFVGANDLIIEHLCRVDKIVKSLGLSPMMWDDMFFFKEYFSYDRLDHLPSEEYLARFPKGYQTIFWDYYADEVETYRKNLKLHKALNDDVVYAGGCFAWEGFGLTLSKTLRATEASLKACREVGVKNVFITTWGDQGNECLQNVNLIDAQIFAENGYADAFDYEKFKKRFAFCTGGQVDDFWLLEDLDYVPGLIPKDDVSNYNTARCMMWQDILLGMADKNYEGYALNDHYAALAQKLAAARERNGQFRGLFDMSYHVAHVLSLKSEMGIRLTAAYRAGDRDALRRAFDVDLPELSRRVYELRRVNRENFMEQYLPFGWDALDGRYGRLLARILSCQETLGEYLTGKIERIEEFELERLPMDGKEGPVHYLEVEPSRIATPNFMH